MADFFSKHKFAILTFMLGVALLFAFYGPVLLAPNDYLFAPDGDGIKNYYTYIYQAQYGDSFSEFKGMNYPYYEHIVYTDAHPFLSWLVGSLGLADYAVGILNLFMLFSYPIGALLLFSILKHYKVNSWWAVAGAVCIAFLSPQVFRMGGHLSLSYVFAIPLMWWLLIQCVNRNPWIWSGLTSAYLIGFFFTHPYLGMIMIFFGFVFWMVRALADRSQLNSSLIHIGIHIILPILIFQGYVAATDSHIDRLSNPAGFFDYYASWKSIIIPHHGPFRSVSTLFDINIGNWESWSYIGFATLVFAGFIGLYLFKQRKIISFRTLLKSELLLFLIAAYLILLFAFCFPLKYSWLRWITDLFGPLKQFRILGRFAWVFYYVFTVSAIVGFYRLYLKEKKKGLLLVFAFGIVFYVLEFIPAHQDMSKSISQSENVFKPTSLQSDLTEAIDFVKLNNFDAILFLPFQHMSSENIMLLGAEGANYDAFLMSYHTQLPLINSISSRMSLSEAKRVNNYFSPGFMEKELTYDLPEDARIVLVKNRDLLSNEELRMIWESEVIFENETYIIFYFDQEKWNSSERFNALIAKERAAQVQLGQGWRSDTTAVWFYYESFDSCKTQLEDTQILGGANAYLNKKESWSTLVSLDNDVLMPGKYTVSFWYYLRIDRPDVEAVVEAKYETGDSSKWIAQFDVKQSTVIAGDWCRIEMEFETTHSMKTFNFLLTGNGNRQPFIVDEFLIQKSYDHALYRRTIQNEVAYIIYNNYWLKADAFQKEIPLYPVK